MSAEFSKWIHKQTAKLPFFNVLEWYIDQTLIDEGGASDFINLISNRKVTKVEFKPEPKVELVTSDFLTSTVSGMPSERKFLLGVVEQIGVSYMILPADNEKIEQHKFSEDKFLHGILDYFYIQYGGPEIV